MTVHHLSEYAPPIVTFRRLTGGFDILNLDAQTETAFLNPSLGLRIKFIDELPESRHVFLDS